MLIISLSLHILSINQQPQVSTYQLPRSDHACWHDQQPWWTPAEPGFFAVTPPMTINALVTVRFSFCHMTVVQKVHCLTLLATTDVDYTLSLFNMSAATDMHLF